MVDSMDELKSSRSVAGKKLPIFLKCWTRLQEEGQSGGTESSKGGSVSTGKTDRLHDL